MKKKDETELLKCPFCGGTPRFVSGINNKKCIICYDCGIGTAPDKHEEDLIRVWNRRI